MLQEKLSEFSRKSKEGIPKEIYAKMSKALEELKSTHLDEKIIKIGDKLPDFDLVDVDGNRYSKSDFKGKKIVLNFFRGSW